MDIFINIISKIKIMHQKIPNSKLEIFSSKIGHMINYEAKEDYIKVIEDFIKNF